MNNNFFHTSLSNNFQLKKKSLLKCLLIRKHKKIIMQLREVRVDLSKKLKLKLLSFFHQLRGTMELRPNNYRKGKTKKN